MAGGQRNRTNGATRKILDYMLHTEGKPVTIDRIAADIGLGSNAVANSASYLVNNKPELGVVRVGLGVYAYRPSTAVTKYDTVSGRVYEGIGKLADGTVIVRDSDTEVLYRLVEL